MGGGGVGEFVVGGGGVPIAVRLAGDEGPPVLLLHGAGCSLSHWGPMLPGLAEGHRVVAMDLRGHGRSGSGPWDVASLMADIEAVRGAHGLGGGAIAGHSMGAVLAHLFADTHADVPAVVNLDGFSLRPSEYVGLDAAEVVERKRRLHAQDEPAVTYSADEVAGRVASWAATVRARRGAGGGDRARRPAGRGGRAPCAAAVAGGGCGDPGALRRCHGRAEPVRDAGRGAVPEPGGAGGAALAGRAGGVEARAVRGVSPRGWRRGWPGSLRVRACGCSGWMRGTCFLLERPALLVGEIRAFLAGA